MAQDSFPTSTISPNPEAKVSQPNSPSGVAEAQLPTLPTPEGGNTKALGDFARRVLTLFDELYSYALEVADRGASPPPGSESFADSRGHSRGRGWGARNLKGSMRKYRIDDHALFYISLIALQLVHLLQERDPSKNGVARSFAIAWCSRITAFALYYLLGDVSMPVLLFTRQSAASSTSVAAQQAGDPSVLSTAQALSPSSEALQPVNPERVLVPKGSDISTFRKLVSSKDREGLQVSVRVSESERAEVDPGVEIELESEEKLSSSGIGAGDTSSRTSASARPASSKSSKSKHKGGVRRRRGGHRRRVGGEESGSGSESELSEEGSSWSVSEDDEDGDQEREGPPGDESEELSEENSEQEGEQIEEGDAPLPSSSTGDADSLAQARTEPSTETDKTTQGLLEKGKATLEEPDTQSKDRISQDEKRIQRQARPRETPDYPNEKQMPSAQGLDSTHVEASDAVTEHLYKASEIEERLQRLRLEQPANYEHYVARVAALVNRHYLLFAALKLLYDWLLLGEENETGLPLLGEYSPQSLMLFYSRVEKLRVTLPPFADLAKFYAGNHAQCDSSSVVGAQRDRCKSMLQQLLCKLVDFEASYSKQAPEPSDLGSSVDIQLQNPYPQVQNTQLPKLPFPLIEDLHAYGMQPLKSRHLQFDLFRHYSVDIIFQSISRVASLKVFAEHLCRNSMLPKAIRTNIESSIQIPSSLRTDSENVESTFPLAQESNPSHASSLVLGSLPSSTLPANPSPMQSSDFPGSFQTKPPSAPSGLVRLPIPSTAPGTSVSTVDVSNVGSVESGTPERVASSDEDPRLVMMRNMALLRLKDQVEKLESEAAQVAKQRGNRVLGQSETKTLTLILPDSHALCNYLDAFRRLLFAPANTGGRKGYTPLQSFCILIAKTVLDELDASKLENEAARKVLRWLEQYIESGNSRLRLLALEPVSQIAPEIYASLSQTYDRSLLEMLSSAMAEINRLQALESPELGSSASASSSGQPFLQALLLSDPHSSSLLESEASR